MTTLRTALLATVIAILAALAGGLSWQHYHHGVPPTGSLPPPVVGDPVLRGLLEAGRLSPAQRRQLVAALPLILRENSQILLDRRRVDEVSQRYLHEGDIGEADFNWLKIIADRYRLEPQSRSDRHFFVALQARLDVVPPSLVLAHLIQQASHAQGGLMVKSLTVRPDGCREALCIGVSLRSGLATAPARDLGPITFSAAGIRRYMTMLNSESTYHDFRRERLAMRQRGEEPRGLPLVDTLPQLPLGAGAYRGSLRQLIILNNLQDMD